MPVSERDPLLGPPKEKSSPNSSREGPVIGEVPGVSYVDPTTLGSSNQSTAIPGSTPAWTRVLNVRNEQGLSDSDQLVPRPDTFESSPNVTNNEATSKQMIENNLSGSSWTPIVKLPENESAWNDLETTGSQQRRYLTCHVTSCQKRIDITDKVHEYVVKCPYCGEGSPLQNAPAGKKYVRCPCSCLLVCKISAQRIQCPRNECKKTINLGSNTTVPSLPQSRLSRVICGHCSSPFLFNTLTNSLAKCPHCSKVSSVGATFAKTRGYWYLALGFALSLAFAIVLWCTINSRNHILWFIVYILLFVPAIMNLFRSRYYLQMKISEIDGTP